MKKTAFSYETDDGRLAIFRACGTAICDWCGSEDDCTLVITPGGPKGTLCRACYDSFAGIIREQFVEQIIAREEREYGATPNFVEIRYHDLRALAKESD